MSKAILVMDMPTNYQRFVNGYNTCIDEILGGTDGKRI